MVAHVVLVEAAVRDVAFEAAREIHCLVERHHEARRVEDVVHLAPLQVQHLSDEPVDHGRAVVRLVWLVGEYWDVRHQLVSDTAGDFVLVQLRPAAILIMLPAERLAISVDHEWHSLLQPHVHEHDCSSRRKQREDCVREHRTIAADLVMTERVLAKKVPKAVPRETLLHLAPGDDRTEALEVGDETEVPVQVE